MTYLLYLFIYFCLTNELLSSPNDIFDELWKNNLSPKDTSTNDLKPNQKVEPYEKQSIGEGKQTSGFSVLKIKEEPRADDGAVQVKHETDDGAVQVKHETDDGAVQVKHETDDGAVQVKHETDDGAVQVKHETDDGAVQVKHETDDGAVQVKHETDDGAVQVKHETDDGAVQDQEVYLSNEESNGSTGGSDYEEKSSDFEGKSDSLSNEELHEKKIIKRMKRISDYEKKKILKQFLEKKERLAKEFGSAPKSKLEEIARGFGTCLRTIRHWRTEFGMGIKKSKYQSKRLSDDKRKKILIKFDKMKEKCIRKNKLKTWTEIEEEIAHKLNVNIRTIFEWKKKFGKTSIKHYSQEEKLKIVKQFEEGKKEYKGKTIEASCYDKECKIANELGVNRTTITRWRKQFGVSRFYIRTESERLQLIKKYFKMIKHNPHVSRDDIAAKLNIPKRTINRWISELKNKISANNIDSNSPNEDVLPFVQPQTFIDENAWAWNRCTKRRRQQTRSAEMFSKENA
uniref:Uncharacterized protein n=1 Tax=Globodera rostochiensis TaxID=31243 RepID=A0A914HTS9_GLORO